MNAKDILARHFSSINSEASILQAAQMLVQHRVSGLPVVDAAGKIVGVVTNADILRHCEKAKKGHSPRWLGNILHLEKSADDYRALLQKKVREVMSEKF